MRILTSTFVARFRVPHNIHPSLLPRLHTHQRAIDAGDRRRALSTS